MLPFFLEAQFKEVQITSNGFHRFHRATSMLITILKYITSIAYSMYREKSLKRPEIDRFLSASFIRPSEGAWLQLLEMIGKDKELTDDNIRKALRSNILDSKLQAIDEIGRVLMHTDFSSGAPRNSFGCLQRVVIIKNRLVSHGSVDETTSVKLSDSLIDIAHELEKTLDPFFTVPIALAEEDYCDDHFDIRWIHMLASTDCVEMPEQSGLNFLLNNKFIHAWPLITMRDGKIMYFSRFDNSSGKVYYSGADKEIYIKTSAPNIASLFGIDLDLLKIKPIEVRVRSSATGINHNLPDGDYEKLIGRNQELANLNELLSHPRHFITALDGIGGVGKSSIAVEYCRRITDGTIDNSKGFEYIIWVSAKSTVFRRGKLERISQSFQHLDQLLDTILVVLGFNEYCNLEPEKKKSIALSIIDATRILLVIDNLETIELQNMTDIWTFVDVLPSPSKVLLTSREFHQNVPQTLRIESMNFLEAEEFALEYGRELGIKTSTLQSQKSEIVRLASGLPLVIKSILAQIYLGRNIRSISHSLGTAGDALVDFCFHEQLDLLTKDQKIILLTLALAEENLDHDRLAFIAGDLIKDPVLDTVKRLRDLSLVKISDAVDVSQYSVLPLVQKYVISTEGDSDVAPEIRKRIGQYYELTDVDAYHLLPIEERAIDRGALIPRKMIDKAMAHATAGEFELAESEFKRAMRTYPSESYVWYMFGNYKAQFTSNYTDAIAAIRKAHEINPNYIYLKKIGDFNLRLRNYQAAIRHYQKAIDVTGIEANQNEMRYSIAAAEYARVKNLRRRLRYNRTKAQIEERNTCYQNIIDQLATYELNQPHIHDTKLARIYRMRAESYFALKHIKESLSAIDMAIDLSGFDDSHMDFKQYILEKT